MTASQEDVAAAAGIEERTAAILPPAELRETEADPEVVGAGEQGPGPEVQDQTPEVPPDVPDLPSLGGIFEDHVVIDEPPPPPPPPKIFDNYPVRKSLFTGITQICLGLVAIGCQTIAVMYSTPEEYEKDVYNYFGAGFFCGAFFIGSGVACCVTVLRKTKKMICCVLIMSALCCCLLCILLFAVSCLGLRYADTTGRYLHTCKTVTFKSLTTKARKKRYCRGLPPLLAADISALIVSILQFFISMRMAILCYHLILKKKQNQLQYIRTPEGLLVVLNKGPDYSDQLSQQSRRFVRTAAGDILFPLQSEAVMKPPPYPADETGKPLDPPTYQEKPPRYYRQAFQTTPIKADDSRHIVYSNECWPDSSKGPDVDCGNLIMEVVPISGNRSVYTAHPDESTSSCNGENVRSVNHHNISSISGSDDTTNNTTSHAASSDVEQSCNTKSNSLGSQSITGSAQYPSVIVKQIHVPGETR